MNKTAMNLKTATLAAGICMSIQFLIVAAGILVPASVYAYEHRTLLEVIHAASVGAAAYFFALLYFKQAKG